MHALPVFDGSVVLAIAPAVERPTAGGTPWSLSRSWSRTQTRGEALGAAGDPSCPLLVLDLVPAACGGVPLRGSRSPRGGCAARRRPGDRVPRPSRGAAPRWRRGRRGRCVATTILRTVEALLGDPPGMPARRRSALAVAPTARRSPCCSSLWSRGTEVVVEARVVATASGSPAFLFLLYAGDYAARFNSDPRALHARLPSCPRRRR